MTTLAANLWIHNHILGSHPLSKQLLPNGSPQMSFLRGTEFLQQVTLAQGLSSAWPKLSYN